ADRVITINGGTAAAIHQVYGIQVEDLTHLGINLQEFTPERRLGRTPQWFEGRPTVIHSTDYSPLKRTELALRVMTAVLGQVPQPLLLISHPRHHPAEINRLKKLADRLGIADNIRWLGFVPREELGRVYASADVGLYTGTGTGASAASLFALECL